MGDKTAEMEPNDYVDNRTRRMSMGDVYGGLCLDDIYQMSLLFHTHITSDVYLPISGVNPGFTCITLLYEVLTTPCICNKRKH